MQGCQPQVACVEAGTQDNELSGSLLQGGFQQIVDEAGPCQPGGKRTGDPALDELVE